MLQDEQQTSIYMRERLTKLLIVDIRRHTG